MMSFIKKPHSTRPGVYVMEVFDSGNNLIATIVPGGTVHEIEDVVESLFNSGPVPETVVAYDEHMRQGTTKALNALSDRHLNGSRSCVICNFNITKEMMECQGGCPANTLRKFFETTLIGDLVEIPNKV